MIKPKNIQDRKAEALHSDCNVIILCTSTLPNPNLSTAPLQTMATTTLAEQLPAPVKMTYLPKLTKSIIDTDRLKVPINNLKNVILKKSAQSTRPATRSLLNAIVNVEHSRMHMEDAILKYLNSLENLDAEWSHQLARE